MFLKQERKRIALIKKKIKNYCFILNEVCNFLWFTIHFNNFLRTFLLTLKVKGALDAYFENSAYETKSETLHICTFEAR